MQTLQRLCSSDGGQGGILGDRLLATTTRPYQMRGRSSIDQPSNQPPWCVNRALLGGEPPQVFPPEVEEMDELHQQRISEIAAFRSVARTQGIALKALHTLIGQMAISHTALDEVMTSVNLDYINNRSWLFSKSI